MKQAIFGSIVVFAAFAVSAKAQDPKIFDEVGNFCCEDFRARMDNFFQELSNRPGERGVVIFYAGKNHPICATARRPRHGEIEFIIKTFDQHIEIRKMPRHRFELIFGGYRETWGAEFWIMPEAGTRPTPKPTVEKRLVKFRKGQSKTVDLQCEP